MSGATAAGSAGRPVGRHGVRWELGAGLGAGMVAAVGWSAQHRMVRAARRSAARAAATGTDPLAMPADVEHRRVVTDDGGSLHVVVRGSGPPVVLLHGIGLSSAIWAGQLHDLGEEHRVVAVDLRGHGESQPGSDGFAGGLRRLAADVRQVLAALSVEHAMLVGHSMGGMVVLQYMAEVPPAERHRRVSGLGLVSTTGGPLLPVPGWAQLGKVVSPLAAQGLVLVDRLGVEALPSSDLRWWTGRLAFGRGAEPAQVAATEQLIRATPLRTLTALIADVTFFDLSHLLPAVDLPTLVVVGSHDHLTPARHALALAAALPDARLLELPGAGHMPMLERRGQLSTELYGMAAAVRGRR